MVAIAGEMIRAYRIDVRTTGTILGHDEVGARIEVLVASAERLDPDEFAERVGGAVRGAVGRLVELVDRPQVVGFTVGGWAYRVFLVPEVADERVRELRLPEPRIAWARQAPNRVFYAGVPRRDAEALADYLMDRVVEGDPRITAATKSAQQRRDREAGLRVTAGHIRAAAGWQLNGGFRRVGH
jgi:hypothetical protein